MATLVLTVLAGGPALAITVVVNGERLPSYPPAVERGGRVLLPMRMIFEALGAEVQWEGATQTAIGIRGDTTVRMSIGDRRAWINDRSVTLDVSPLLIGGSTYMPVRFPAEAFGADVGWSGATQTVSISLAPPDEPPQLPGPGPTEPAGPGPTEPPAPPAPQPGTVTGTVQAVRTTGRPSLTLEVEGDLVAYEVTPDTIILRQGRQAVLGDLQPGDEAEVRYDARRNAVVVRATFEETTGTVAAKAGNKLLLEDGRLFVLRPTVTVIGPTGAELSLGDLEVGQQVALWVTPGTDAVSRILLQQAPAPPPPTPPAQAAPEIDLFYHTAREPLRAGSVLAVTLIGTPKGTAWFDIGDKVKNIALREVARQPGRYQVEWVVPDGANAIGVNLYGHLQVGNREAEVAQSEEPVIIDTTPPTISEVAPEDGAVLRNNTPNILALFDDANGSGVAEATMELFSNGKRRNVEYRSTNRFVSAVPEGLPDGDVEAIVRVADKAGNATEQTWSFVVNTRGAPAVAVTHDAAEPLRTGDTLTVVLTGPPGGTATFSVGNVAEELPMAEDARTPGRYRGSYRIPYLRAGRTIEVSGDLETAQGQQLTAQATAEVVLLPGGALPAPTITTPREGAAVRGGRVVVEGTTVPRGAVKIKLEYTARGAITNLPYSGALTDTEVTADAAGDFQTEGISLSVPVLLPRDIRYKLTAVTVGPDGQESEPTVVNFRPG